MAISFKTISEAIGDSGVKILVFGPAGSGKTVLLSTILRRLKRIHEEGGAKRKLLIISAESGLLSLQDLPQELQDYMQVVEVSTIEDVDEVYNLLTSDSDHPFDWIALDSVTEIAEVLLANEKQLSPDPRKSYVAAADKMFALLRSFRDLPNVNVVMSAKEQKYIDDNGVATFGPMMPGNQLRQGVAYLFDEVFALHAIQVDAGDGDKRTERKIQTGLNLMRDCKDRSGKLSMWEDPDLTMIVDKIKGEYVAPPEKEPLLPTEEELEKADQERRIKEDDELGRQMNA